MANITINEVSQNYTYNIGSSSFAQVALPITACWGPGFEDSVTAGAADDETLESVVWSRFEANQAGLQSFVSTFRGPTTQYIQHRDYSYYVAMSLLTAGYDVLVCRVATGSQAAGEIKFATKTSSNSVKNGDPVTKGTTPTTSEASLSSDGKQYTIVTKTVEDVEDDATKEQPVTITTVYTFAGSLNVKAKYLGSFGNSLRVTLRRKPRIINNNLTYYWNLITYVEDTVGIRTAVENINFVFDVEQATNTILHIDEVDSKFLTFETTLAPENDEVLLPEDLITHKTDIPEASRPEYLNYLVYNEVTQTQMLTLHGGSDVPATSGMNVAQVLDKAKELARNRYAWATFGDSPTLENYTTIDSEIEYLNSGLNRLKEVVTDPTVDVAISLDRANSIYFREWMYTAAYTILSTLEDKLAYNPNRIIVPGWDDQDFKYILDDESETWDIDDISPLHARLLEVAYISRCATAYIDIPRSISRKMVYNESLEPTEEGYAQRLARSSSVSLTVEGSYYASHSALFAPWGKYTYTGTSKQAVASPSFIALLIERSMIKNQTSQYEWLLPTTRKNNVKLGKLDYNISKKYLDVWQSIEGVGVNCITSIPGQGISIWGNSTLFEVPPATYQALANLSTRKLVNAVEDLAYKCGIDITFQYNNDQAYNAFYAGMTPLLDTMRNQGAIQDYYLRMAADINGLDQVNANSVVGTIYLVIEGVVNDITVDLIALPPTADLNEYRS